MLTQESIVSLIEYIAEGLKAEIKETDKSFIMTISDYKFETSKEKIEGALENLSNFQEFEETKLYEQNRFETLVKDASQYRRPPFSFLFREEDIVFEDEVNNITYELSRPSNEFILFFLNKISKIAPPGLAFSPFPYRLRKKIDEGDMEMDIFSIIFLSFQRLYSLKIHTKKRSSLRDFEKYANSFIFQLSYNLDIPVVIQTNIDDYFRGRRITRLRRTRLKDMLAPKRAYIPDLIYHYQMALASEGPPHKYLSYYHVAEYFYDSVFEGDLIEKIRDTITQPDFSYKRKSDIKRIINQITSSLKLRQDQVVFSEKEALRLTLMKFLDLNVLIDKICEYDEGLIDYYSTHPVEFSKGDIFNLKGIEKEGITKSIANRIYKTRNSIVHSKEGVSGKYIPFEHDKLLVKEVPLLRFIAEQIILESSRDIT